MKNAKFMVVDPHWREYNEKQYPCSLGIPSAGLAYVIASVKDEGGEIVSVEQFFTEKKERPQVLSEFHRMRDQFVYGVLKKAVSEKCDALLVTITNGAYHHVLKLIDQAKETNLKIIIGGSFITLTNLQPSFRHMMLKNSDNTNVVLVAGEGEQPIKEITKRIMGGNDFRNIPGVTFKEKGKIIECNSEIPKYRNNFVMPDYSDIDKSKMGRSLLVSRSRGCPALCSFCDERDVFQGYRLNSNGGIIAELKGFVENYGTKTFKFTDSTFTVTEKGVIEFCKSIINEGLNSQIQWLAYARIKEVQKFEQSTLELMNDAGCFGLHYGFETFDDCVLANVKKGFKTFQEAMDVVKKTKEADIKVSGSFMNGFPGQTEEALWRSVEYSINLDLDCYNIHAAVPPIKQMDDSVKENVNPIFRLWNNDPNIPPNLFSDYTQWHISEYGFPDTLGRHTSSKELAVGLKPTVQKSAYNLLYSDETLVNSIEMFMAEGRETVEYDLFFQ